MSDGAKEPIVTSKSKKSNTAKKRRKKTSEKTSKKDAVVTVPKRRSLVRFGFLSRHLGFNLFANSDDNIGDDIDYSPNVGSLVQIQLSTEYLSGSYSTSTGAGEDPEIYGESKAVDYRLSLNRKNWIFRGHYAKYSGYYIDNSSAFIESSSATGEVIKYPQLELTGLNLGLIYVFDGHELSYRAAYDQTLRQKKFGWSWLSEVDFDYVKITNPTPFIPKSQWVKRASDEAQVRELRGNSLSIAGGAGFLKPFGNYYIALSLLFGPGWQFIDYKHVKDDSLSNFGGFKFSMQLGAGYNGTLWVSGMSFNYNSIAYRLRHEQITVAAFEGMFFVGRRLDFSGFFE